MNRGGNYIRSLGTNNAPIAPATLDSISAQNAQIIAQQKADASSRRWATIFAVAGALFAAIKLGVIAIPHLRRRRAHAVGQLTTGAPAQNPRRRRR